MECRWAGGGVLEGSGGHGEGAPPSVNIVEEEEVVEEGGVCGWTGTWGGAMDRLWWRNCWQRLMECRWPGDVFFKAVGIRSAMGLGHGVCTMDRAVRQFPAKSTGNAGGSASRAELACLSLGIWGVQASPAPCNTNMNSATGAE
jgi:hypothetical protein